MKSFTLSKVTKIVKLDKAETYDLTVQNNHNFFSFYSGKPILTHNCVAELMIGRIRHNTHLQGLKAKIYVRNTKEIGVAPKKPYRDWMYAQKFLFNSPTRNISIAKAAVRDAERGHMVLIPTVEKQHQRTLFKLINQFAGEKICFLFNGEIPKKKRQEVRNMMNKDKKIKVVIATRSMLPGLNIPRFSAIYTVAPIANNPNYEQEVKRVCTPFPGKRSPIIRFWLDGSIPMFVNSWRTCLEYLSNGEFEYSKSFKVYKEFKNERKKTAIDEFEKQRFPHGMGSLFG